MNSIVMRAKVRVASLAGALFAGVAISACAEKDLLVPNGSVTKAVINVSIVADQQVGFGPRFLVAAAGFDGEGEEDGGFLGYTVIPYAPGNHTLRVEVNLAPCLAYFAGKGRGACQMLIGAAIVPDTAFLTDTTDVDPFENAFDFFVTDPINVGASGTLPTVQVINLSASRFGVVKWEEDEALRVGGVNTPTGFTTAPTGVPGPGGTVTLFAGSVGYDFAAQPVNQFGPPPGPFPQLAILENGAWRKVFATVIPPTSQGAVPGFNSVAAISGTEVYLGHQFGLYKYDGSTITKVASVTDSIFSVGSVVTPTGQKRVIAGAGAGFIWIGDGTTFTRQTAAGTTQRIDGVCVTSATEAFASSTGGGLWRHNGTSWVSVPATFSAAKTQLQCPAPGQAFVIASQQAFLTWNGATWNTITATGLGGRLADWGVVSPTEIYAAGDSASVDRAFYRFNGQTWQEIGRKRFVNTGSGLATLALRRLWADPRGGAAYYSATGGFARLERITPSGVTVLSYQPSFRDIHVSSPTNAFAIGWNLALARWDGVKWNFDPSPPRTQSVRIMAGVWSDGPNNAWAVGGVGTIYHFNGSVWSVVSENLAPITGVTENYNGVWGSGSDVWIAGARGVTRCRSTSSCVVEYTTSDTLNSIWGSGPSNIFAVGQRGKIHRYNGTSWSEMASPTGINLARVHGSGPENVWAIGHNGLIRFNGTAWGDVPRTQFAANGTFTSPGPGQSLFQLGLFVRSATEVYIGGDNGISRWDGKEWNEMRLGFHRRRVLGISMAPQGCGFALMDGGNDLPAATLARGIGPSGCMSAPSPPVTSWP
jgi:hypothetical protein